MKKAVAIALLSGMVIPALAAIMGTLVRTESVTTVTGKLAYRCTYNVMGREAVVMLDHLCPPTMNFE